MKLGGVSACHMVDWVAEGIAWHCRMCLCMSNSAPQLGACLLTCGPALHGALAGLWLLCSFPPAPAAQHLLQLHPPPPSSPWSNLWLPPPPPPRQFPPCCCVQGISALPRVSVYRPGEGRLVTIDVPFSRVKVRLWTPQAGGERVGRMGQESEEREGGAGAKESQSGTTVRALGTPRRTGADEGQQRLEEAVHVGLQGRLCV